MRPIEEFKPGLYKHYRGHFYIALFLVRHHETGEFLVVYTSSSDHTVNVREWDTPGKDSWCDQVTWHSGCMGSSPITSPRFEYKGSAL